MNAPLLAAAIQLADALAAENDALSRMDLAAAARLLPQKNAAVAAFSAAQAGGMVASPGLRAVADRLQAAAADNRRLLERAIAVQNRVLGTLAQAARTANAMPGYGRSGAPASRQGGAWALRAQA